VGVGEEKEKTKGKKEEERKGVAKAHSFQCAKETTPSRKEVTFL